MHDSDQIGQRTSGQSRYGKDVAGEMLGPLSALERVSESLRAEERAGNEHVIGRRSELLERLERAGDEARELLLRNLIRHAIALRRTTGVASAIPFAERAVELATQVTVPGRPYVAADALWLTCRYSFDAERPRDAMRFADRLLASFASIPDVADEVAGALYIKSNCLGKLGAGADAQVEVLDSLIARFVQTGDTRVERLVALSLYTKGDLLERSGDRVGADATWDTVFQRFRVQPPTQIEWVPFRAQERRIKSRLAAGEIDQAAALVQELIACPDRLASVEALIEVARTMLRTGVELERAGKLEAALSLFEWPSERLNAGEEPRLARLRVRAGINAGVLHGKMGDLESATAAMERITSAGQPALETLEALATEARDPNSHVPGEREPWALLVKGLVLRSLGRDAEARDTLASVTAGFSESDSAIVRQVVSAAANALDA